MTNELEKQFFQCFGIEAKQFIKDFPTREKAAAFGRKITGIPKYNKDKFEIGSYTNNIDIFQVHWRKYPQITDRILLELICILTCWHLDEREPYEITSINIEQLKNQILSNSLYIAKYAKAKKRVQALFKEG